MDAAQEREAWLFKRQIAFAAYCRFQAATIRRENEGCRFPKLREMSLGVALMYERNALSAEQFAFSVRYRRSAAALASLVGCSVSIFPSLCSAVTQNRVQTILDTNARPSNGPTTQPQDPD
jgi:hypothetical protein